MYNEIDLDKMDINADPPIEEPARQYYFMAKCQAYVKAESERLGRPLFAVVKTFGCQMNTEHEIQNHLRMDSYKKAGKVYCN